jgi:hypothetical protein
MTVSLEHFAPPKAPVVLAQAMLSTLLASLLFATSAKEPEKPLKVLPILSGAPKLDGALKDLTPALEVKLPAGAHGASADLALKAAFRKDTLYVGLTVRDDQVLPDDHLDLTLFFPESGTTARGVVFRFGSEGLRVADPDVGAPEWAQALVQAATRRDEKGFTLEVAIPARAFPRFQAFKQLALNVCAEYSDVDAAGGEASLLSTCPSGEMAGGPTRLPDELRKTLKLSPSPEVEGIEAREHGWVGFSKLHYPTWAEGEAALTPGSLAELVLGDAAVDPSSAALPIPLQLILPDNRPIFTMLTGKNPYLKKDACADGNELRMAMYVVKGVTAARVLEWPAATCKLGRAMRFELSAEGELTIGYTNGSTAHFTWAGDHFERSELGLVH